MEVNRIILLSSKGDELTAKFIKTSFNFHLIRTKEELVIFEFNKSDVLLSYNTNVIVPIDIIQNVYLAVNVHAASPDFPGRDPHHWAIYRKAKEYGATLHFMTEKVDHGKIIKTELFNVKNDDTPYTLLKKADDYALKIIDWFLIELKKQITFDSLNINWGEFKTNRKDMLKLFDLSEVDENEMNIRRKAFYSPIYKNLYFKKYGFIFYMD
jgi:methionyl-tRNA formyltransferase